MAYTYTKNTYLYYITSRINPQKIFIIRPDSGPKSGDTNYYTEQEAIEAAIKYDSETMPMLPTTGSSTTASNIITFQNYTGSGYQDASLANCVKALNQQLEDWRITLSYGDPTLDNIDPIKDVILNVQNIYNKADRLIINIPQEYSEYRPSLQTLLSKVNTAFSIKIPTATILEDLEHTSFTYNYNKITNQWELQS